MATFSSDITKNSLCITHHHTALFFCSIQENCTSICLQRNPPWMCNFFHCGDNVASRKLGVTHSFIHTLTHFHRHSTEIYMSSFFPANTKKARNSSL